MEVILITISLAVIGTLLIALVTNEWERWSDRQWAKWNEAHKDDLSVWEDRRAFWDKQVKKHDMKIAEARAYRYTCDREINRIKSMNDPKI